jgi:hypothetical protein
MSQEANTLTYGCRYRCYEELADRDRCDCEHQETKIVALQTTFGSRPYPYLRPIRIFSGCVDHTDIEANEGEGVRQLVA